MGGNAVILLDTHIFLWMNLQPEKMPQAITEAIAVEPALGIAAISLWETAMLVQYRRIIIPDSSLREWFQAVLPTPKLRVLPLTPEIASRSATLDMHGDPADRLIAATALEHGCRLATVDNRLTELDWLKTV
jgi:PIN domain nuclease of toxin-antitoxin system